MVGKLRSLIVLVVSALALASLAGTASAQELRAPDPEPMPSGVAGTVALADQPCPFAGCGLQATVIARQGNRVVGWTETDARGRYRMELPGGKYELLAWPRIRHVYCRPRAVYVPWGKHVRVDFGCRWVRPDTEEELPDSRP